VKKTDFVSKFSQNEIFLSKWANYSFWQEYILNWRKKSVFYSWFLSVLLIADWLMHSRFWLGNNIRHFKNHYFSLFPIFQTFLGICSVDKYWFPWWKFIRFFPKKNTAVIWYSPRKLLKCIRSIGSRPVLLLWEKCRFVLKFSHIVFQVWFYAYSGGVHIFVGYYYFILCDILYCTV